jgi:hypothetical protein
MRYAGLLPAALALVLVLPALLPLTAWAAGDRERQVVYNGEIFDGQGYGGQFYPANEPAIYVLADVQNVFIPRITQVYWWPITQEYKADWDSLNQPLTGTLEIGTRSFPLTTYSLRHDNGFSNAQTELIVDDAAAPAYAAYQKALSDYQAAAGAYNEQWQVFQQQLAEWGQKADELRAAGKSTADLPVPKQPVQPTQPTVSVTAPAAGIAFTLPAGEYQMVLRGTDGNIVPGSERRIVAFGPRRSGVAYKVIAESKYTLPDASTNPQDTIFVSGEKALYVQPAAQREYDNFYAAKLLNPQQRAAQDRRGVWTWLPAGEFPATSLALNVSGATENITKVKYYAKQRPGAALGDDILPYDASAGEGVATFDAFKIVPQRGAMTISAPGVADSSRDIRVVQTGAGNVLIGLAFLPLAGGLCGLAYRRWRTR